MAKTKAATETKKGRKKHQPTPLRLSLNDLLAAAKVQWSEGSLHDEAIAAEQAGTLQPSGDSLAVRDVATLLITPGCLPPERRYERRHVDQWDYTSEYSDAIEDEQDFGTNAAVTLCDVITADAGTIRVGVYEDDAKSSIDRVPADATLLDVACLWHERWDGDVPKWVSNLIKDPADAFKVDVQFEFDRPNFWAFGSVRAAGPLTREDCEWICKGLLEELFEKHGHVPDKADAGC